MGGDAGITVGAAEPDGDEVVLVGLGCEVGGAGVASTPQGAPAAMRVRHCACCTRRTWIWFSMSASSAAGMAAASLLR